MTCLLNSLKSDCHYVIESDYMNIIRCPNCGGVDLNVYDTDGGCEKGRIAEDTECLDCDCNFTVVAELSDINIEIGVRNGKYE